MTIAGNQRTVRCMQCGRSMHPERVEGGANTKVALIVAGQLMPLKCTHCGRIVCHECQGGSSELGASRISMFCQSCGQTMDVLGYSPGVAADATDKAKRGGGAVWFAIIVIAAVIAGWLYLSSGR